MHYFSGVRAPDGAGVGALCGRRIVAHPEGVPSDDAAGRRLAGDGGDSPLPALPDRGAPVGRQLGRQLDVSLTQQLAGDHLTKPRGRPPR